MKKISKEARSNVRRLASWARVCLVIGLLLLVLAPVYAYIATNYSGSLTLAQQIPAAQATRGFNFGPVYLEQGEVGRYRISATMPQTEGDFWHTTFEVLDDKLTSVYSQDELRFIGDYQFTPGQTDNFSKTFAMDKATGYYYFRFTAVNGTYDANPMDLPVVSFCIRQGVISGPALWGPVIGGLLLGLLLLIQAIRLIWLYGAKTSEDREPGARKSRKDIRGYPVEPGSRFVPSGR